MSEKAGHLGISVVIPFRDQGESLARLLFSLEQNLSPKVPTEILVIDDGSQEAPTALCSTFGARRIAIGETQGPANARNEGARQARFETLLFLDADTRCPPGLIDKIVEVFTAHPDAPAISFLNQGYDAGQSMVSNYAAVIERYWLGSYLGGVTELAQVPGVTSRNAAVRKSSFEAIGGFDASFCTNAIEDYDFGKRLAARGKTLLAAAPIVSHEFPHRFRRLARNYWVRTATFIPYYLRARPKLDPVQVAPKEAALRLVASGSLILLVSALFAGHTVGIVLVGFGVALAYGLAIRGFLVCAAGWSGSLVFAARALVLHFVTSPVIVSAAAWGALVFLVRRARKLLTRSSGVDAAEGRS